MLWLMRCHWLLRLWSKRSGSTSLQRDVRWHGDSNLLQVKTAPSQPAWPSSPPGALQALHLALGDLEHGSHDPCWEGMAGECHPSYWKQGCLGKSRPCGKDGMVC
jgi:hypothetical protein